MIPKRSFKSSVRILFIFFCIVSAGCSSTSKQTSFKPEVSKKAPPVSSKPTWLVMLYQDADDEALEEDIFIDLNEAELAGPSDQVTVIAQMDRHRGGRFREDGGWTTVRRFELKQDSDLNHIKSKEIVDLGELDSGDKQTLVDFATWAIRTYPAEKYALILSDHGGGWTGGWTDDDPKLDSRFSVNDIDNSLSQIIANTAIERFEFVGFDACLMSQIESLTALIPYARYAAASEEIEPGLGWAYAYILQKLNANPQMTGADLARAVVEGYIVKDVRVVNDQARRKFLDEDPETEGLNISAEDLANELSKDVTMTAVDLTRLKAVIPAINQLAILLTDIDSATIAKARSYSQAYYNVIDDYDPSPYIDLGNFINLVDENTKQLNSSAQSEVSKTIDSLNLALKNAVIAEKHGEDKPGSSGFTIYFPVSATFELTLPGMNISYVEYASRFAAASLWNEFLVEFFTGQKFDPDLADLTVLEADSIYTAQPPAQTSIASHAIVAPGAGQITIQPLQLDRKEIRSGESIQITTEISGDNVGYIYLYTFYFDEESNSYLTTDVDYIVADLSQVVNGVIYPVWDTVGGVIPFEVDWEANIYYLSDGDEKNDQFALFEPQWYGIVPENNHYQVRGSYTMTGQNETRAAVLEFSGDGSMHRMLVYSGEEASGEVSDYTPEKGDRFTAAEQWLDFSQNPEGELVIRPGGSIIFGDEPVRGVPHSAVPGKYLLGVVVEDLDGNLTSEWVGEIYVSEE